MYLKVVKVKSTNRNIPKKENQKEWKSQKSKWNNSMRSTKRKKLLVSMTKALVKGFPSNKSD